MIYKINEDIFKSPPPGGGWVFLSYFGLKKNDRNFYNLLKIIATTTIYKKFYTPLRGDLFVDKTVHNVDRINDLSFVINNLYFILLKKSIICRSHPGKMKAKINS